VTEFRAALFSVALGYTRTNVELAATLLALGRAREAVAILQPAFRGPLEASNIFVTRTELHAALARAWDAAGQPDSAVAHYRVVVEDLRLADELLRPRRDSALVRLQTLSGGSPRP
jgi:hypothetical protein